MSQIGADGARSTRIYLLMLHVLLGQVLCEPPTDPKTCGWCIPDENVRGGCGGDPLHEWKALGAKWTAQKSWHYMRWRGRFPFVYPTEHNIAKRAGVSGRAFSGWFTTNVPRYQDNRAGEDYYIHKFMPEDFVDMRDPLEKVGLRAIKRALAAAVNWRNA